MERKSEVARVLSAGLGLGYLPLAPGTWASAGAAAVYWLLCTSRGGVHNILAPLVLATLFLGVFLGGKAERLFGRKDPGEFVLDEVAGQWLTLLFFWWSGRSPWQTALAAFIAFRVFDVVKPYPVRQLEKLPGGWGIMADDLAAALYSALSLWIVCPLLIDRLLA